MFLGVWPRYLQQDAPQQISNRSNVSSTSQCCSTGLLNALQRVHMYIHSRFSSCESTRLSAPESAMADRPGKLARLQSLRSRLPYISQSALSQLLRLAAQEELPGTCQRLDVRQARDRTVATHTPYGALHQQVAVKDSDGNDLELEVQHPFAMFWHACASSMQRCAAAHDAANTCLLLGYY